MKFFLIRFSIIGLIIPLIVLPIAYGTNLGKGGISFPIFGLLWPTYLQLIALTKVESAFHFIRFIAVPISFNVLYYLFLGWLFWLGKTKSKGFYVLMVVIIVLIWDLIYLGLIIPVG